MKSLNELLLVAFVLLALMLLVGCSSYEPKPMSDSKHLTAWGSTNQGAQVSSLFELAGATQLRGTVLRALGQSPDVQKIALSLQQSQLQTNSAGTSKIPQVNGNIQSGRQGSTPVANTASLGFDLSWELDIWGRLADLEQAALFSEKATAEDFRAAQNSLAARLIQALLDIQTSRQIVAIESQRLEALTLNEQFVRQRYQQGLGSLSDLEAARSEAAAARSNLFAREALLAEQQRTWNFLQGIAPSTEIKVIPSIEPVPVWVAPPAEVLANRPDVAAALYKVHASQSEHGVAQKTRLPGLSLTGNGSQMGSSINNALAADPAWSYLMNLSLPIFKGGKLAIDVQISELSIESAFWEYQQVVLTALREVQDRMANETLLADQQREIGVALKHARANERVFKARYQSGIADVLDLLNAQRRAYDFDVQLLELQLNQQKNRVDLGLAIGLGVI